MKKCLASLLLCTLVLCAAIPGVWAGDSWYIMMNGGQDALILGEITGQQDGLWVVEVRHNIPCYLQREERTKPLPLGPILVDFERYSYYFKEQRQPMVGDFLFASLDAHGDNYRIATRTHIVMRADSADYATLRFVDMLAEERTGYEARLHAFVNSNGLINSFQQENGIVYAYDGEERVLIYGDQMTEVYVPVSGAPEVFTKGGQLRWDLWRERAVSP